jgi:serine/threonine-protein kinase HipA
MNVATVTLWGSTIGAISWNEDRGYSSFQYQPRFTKSGIQVAPLMMPLSNTIYSFPTLSKETFQGLPGMLADALPDKFGNAVINAWLAQKGRSADSMDPVEKLCYIGARGMGALEFVPAKGPRPKKASKIAVDELVQLASEILTERENFRVSLTDKHKEAALREILRVGTSAGGARPKAIIAWNPDTNEVRSGKIESGSGFSYWLLKFDGVSGNKDKGFTLPLGYGLVEYAYYKMALAAGIEMRECQILEENGRHHFMAKRFDRTNAGEKFHMQSLCALAHFDYNQPAAYSYEQAFQVLKRLGLPMSATEELFRRMAFNVIARNQDDHVKNIALLMNKEGHWSLSPAFDTTYAYDPLNKWLGKHQMSLNGKRDGFVLGDFDDCAKTISLKRGVAKTILSEVQSAVSDWRKIAEDSGVPAGRIKKIGDTHRKIAAE